VSSVSSMSSMSSVSGVSSRSFHRRSAVRIAAGAAAGAAVTAALSPVAFAQGSPTVLVALTMGGDLVRFNSAAPSAVAGRVRVSGLAAGDTLVGIDYRPANKQLYAVGSSGRLYTLNPLTGAAAAAAPAALNPAPNGTAFGVDFNPVPDRLRLVSDTGQNLRINVDTAEVTVDGALAYAAGDRSAGAAPRIVAAGYTNSVAGATSTTLYVVDSTRDILATQNPPNEGVLNTVGPLGIDTSDMTGFDVAPEGNVAYAALTAPSARTASTLYAIDLATGAARQMGQIGGGQPIRGLAVALDPAAVPVGPGALLPATGGFAPAIPAASFAAAALLSLAGVWSVRRRAQ
jgi:hypothetical protein